jgi:hypothetical protein
VELGKREVNGLLNQSFLSINIAAKGVYSFACAPLSEKYSNIVSPSVTFGRCYLFGGGRALQVVKEQDAAHDPGELQTGQNTTVQAHPHLPVHSLPLNVWPLAAVATVGR